MGAPAGEACRACADSTARPPGTLAGGGSSLSWWNRLTTTLGDTWGHLRGTSCTRDPTDVLSIQPKKKRESNPTRPLCMTRRGDVCLVQARWRLCRTCQVVYRVMVACLVPWSAVCYKSQTSLGSV